MSVNSTDPRAALRELCRQTRARTLELAAPLSAEDQLVQSMPDASPVKWHLAHTTWFFEAMLLGRIGTRYRAFDAAFAFLFNSYYEALGERHPRPMRGVITRPSLDEVLAYRAHVDQAMQRWFDEASAEEFREFAAVIELGCAHEQQHQELILTDILHAFSLNPLLPAYRHDADAAGLLPRADARPRTWLPHRGGVTEIGHDGSAFAFDNERPRHAVLLQPFAIASRLVTQGEYLTFIQDGGYAQPAFWLSEGWALIGAQQWQSPLYWRAPNDPRLLPHLRSNEWQAFGLGGLRPLNMDAPITHVSFHEAYAFAAWSHARLPTEFEWEAASRHDHFAQGCDQAWQWTRTSYDPYPGFRPFSGDAAEYNGKFMVGQLVLRGGSLATSPGHTRTSYRNFFPPSARWQFSGIRLAMDA